MKLGKKRHGNETQNWREGGREMGPTIVNNQLSTTQRRLMLDSSRSNCLKGMGTKEKTIHKLQGRAQMRVSEHQHNQLHIHMQL